MSISSKSEPEHLVTVLVHSTHGSRQTRSRDLRSLIILLIVALVVAAPAAVAGYVLVHDDIIKEALPSETYWQATLLHCRGRFRRHGSMGTFGGGASVGHPAR